MQLPGYRVERLIAEGGMASVYLAVQESLDRFVAVKLLKRFDNPTQTLRFYNEGRIIASLNHRNIITIHDIGVVDEQPYIAMEYLQGGDLRQRIAKGMEVDEALGLLETLGSCLDFVHRKGIIHRDIKPENILFHEDSTPIITDFGIAKQYAVDSSLTMDGTALGSPHYLSPEQAGCKALDGRADLYSLGILFYEMVTGAKPYQGDSAIDIIMAHVTARIPRLPKALRAYQTLLERMIAKAPDERFDCAASLVEYVRVLRECRPRAAVKAISGVLHGCRDSIQLKTMPETTRGATLRIGLASTPGTGNQPLTTGKLREIFSVISKPSLVGSALLGVLLIAGALYQILSAPARQPVAAIAEVQPKNTVPADPEAKQAAAVNVAEPALDEQAAAVNGAEPTLADQGDLAVSAPNPVIVEYLALADYALKSYRLTTPEGDNAYYYYQQVLDLNPVHEDALKGIAAVADAYADLADSAFHKHEYRKVKTFVRRGLAVQPDNRRLLGLERRSNTVRYVHKPAETNTPFDFGQRFIGKIKSVFD
jgi:serine/threonine protein kinase